MLEQTVTTDLVRFTFEERAKAARLLKAWATYGLPTDFTFENVVIACNKRNGLVFLTNDDYQAAALKHGKLQSFYFCTECEHEGFIEQMKHKGKAQCRANVREIKRQIKGAY